MTSDGVEQSLQGISDCMKAITIVIFAFVIILTWIWIILTVNAATQSVMIQTVDNACLTISSITLAAIIAIIAIIVARAPEKPIKYTVFYFAIPSIAGALTGLFSMLFSFMSLYDPAKNLFALTIGFTVVSLVILFIIMNFEKDNFFR